MARSTRRRSYADRLTHPLPGYRDVWRMLRERGSVRDLTADRAAIPVAGREAPLPPVAAGTAAVTWAGHASFVIRIAGFTVLTDPVWSRRIPGVTPRLTLVGVSWDALPPVDAVLISHNHYDHLDAPTIRMLPRQTRILAPANLGRWFRKRGFQQVVELDWWQTHLLPRPAGDDSPPLRLDFVPAHHWSRRGLRDTCRSLWGGWMLTSGDGQRVYFAGDTGYGPFFREIGDRFPGVELALMPVGAYEPQWFMQAMHLNPEEAVRACDDLGATRMATMHWGTFLLSGEPVTEPAERAAKAWASAGRPREHLWDLAIGETRTW